MQLGDRPNLSEAQLVGYSVLDRQGYLLGQVLKTLPRPDDQFALLVQYPASKAEMAELIVENESITKVDSQASRLYTDLDFNLVVPTQGKTIPLVAERALVKRHRRKVGEVVVRKVVETDWVQIPIHRETLLIEQAGKPTPLAEISLGETRVSGDAAIAPAANRYDTFPTESLGYWSSLVEASQTLEQFAQDEAIASLPIRVVLVIDPQRPTEKVTLEFPTTNAAAQMLNTIAEHWQPLCQGVYLETI